MSNEWELTDSEIDTICEAARQGEGLSIAELLVRAAQQKLFDDIKKHSQDYHTLIAVEIDFWERLEADMGKQL